MVFASRVDFGCAVELFKQHHAEEFVREGHFRYRQTKVGTAFEGFIQPVGRADQEADLRSLTGTETGAVNETVVDFEPVEDDDDLDVSEDVDTDVAEDAEVSDGEEDER